ncbi:MAG: hypothetical protein ACRBCJ_10380 [Hyphomicrobiaceae bacterium]
MNTVKKTNNFARRASVILALCSTGLAPAFLHSPARAMGYSSINCNDLWERKQTIYKDNFYCLTEPAAIEKFGNTDCTIKDLSIIQFSNDDMNTLMLIARNEERKECPKATPLLKETPLAKE